MTSLGDAFKLVCVEVNLSNNKIIIKDSIVEVNVVIESWFPKEIVCSQATISVEEVKDGKRQSDLPNPRPHEPSSERKHSGLGRRHSAQNQKNSSGDSQHNRYVTTLK